MECHNDILQICPFSLDCCLLEDLTEVVFTSSIY